MWETKSKFTAIISNIKIEALPWIKASYWITLVIMAITLSVAVYQKLKYKRFAKESEKHIIIRLGGFRGPEIPLEKFLSVTVFFSTIIFGRYLLDKCINLLF